MSEEKAQERTEEPTPKRLEEFRREGRTPKSREIGSVGILLAAFGFFQYGLDMLSNGLLACMRNVLAELDRPFGAQTAIQVVARAAVDVAFPGALLLGSVALTGIAIAFLQSGWHPKEDFITIDFERLNPVSGFGRYFSLNSVVELAKGVMELAVLGVIAYFLLKDELIPILEMPRTGLRAAMDRLAEVLFLFMKRALIFLAILAALDFLYQWWNNQQQLRMTKQEVKQESKDTDGNPQVKSRLRRLARERLQARSGLKNVPEADVVVTNPDHYAIALKYTVGKMRAPVVVARGQDRIAELIKAEARKHNIPRVENRYLARTWYKLTKVGDEVPPNLYMAVAEVLAFVYRIKQQSH